MRGGRWRRVAPVLAMVVLVTLVPLLVQRESTIALLTLVGVFSIAAMALDLIKGYMGVLSLGQAAFMAVGAYATALLTTKYGLPWFAALPAGIVLAAVIAAVVGYPVMRLTLDNAALATLGLGIIVQNIFLGLQGWSGGGSGVAGVPPLSFFGYRLSGERANFWAIWTVVLLVYVLLRGLLASRHGRALRTIKVDEGVAAAMAIDVYRVKLHMFVLAAAISSLGGSLLAHTMQFISPDMVGLDSSLSLVTMVILGGEGTLLGPVLGALVLKTLPQQLALFRDYQLVINGALLLVILRFSPRGVVGTAQHYVARRARQRQSPVGLGREVR